MRGMRLLAAVTVLLVAGAACGGGKAPRTRAAAPGEPAAPEGSTAPPSGEVASPGQPTGTGPAQTPPGGGRRTSTRVTAPGGTGGGTGGGAQAAYQGEVGVTKDTVAIGYIYPRSGAFGALLTNVEPAVKAAMQEIGEIHGRRMVFVGEDDGYNNASQAAAAARALKDRVLGYTTLGILSGTVVSAYADENRIPMLAGNIDRATALKMRYVFAVSTFLETQATILPSFIRNVLGKGNEKIGIIYQTTPQIAVIREHFKEAAAKLGLTVVREQPVEENPSTCVNEVSNLQSAGARVVPMFTSPVPAIRCLLDARTIGYAPTWTGVGPTFNFNITNTGSGRATEGIRMLSNFRTLESPMGQKFQAQMRKYYPNNPDLATDDLAMVMWGQTYMWAEGLRRAGPNLTREGFVAAMETLRDYDFGFFAPATYGPGNRFVSNKSIVVKAQGGQWITEDPVWRSSY